MNICSNKQLWRWMDRQVFSQGYGPHLPSPTLTPHPQLRIYTFACHHAPCTMHHATMHHASCHHAPCHHSMPPCHPYLPRLCDCWLHTYFSGGFARWLGMFNVCFWTPGMGVFELRNAKRLWFRYPKTPFQAHGVQRYACWERSWKRGSRPPLVQFSPTPAISSLCCKQTFSIFASTC